MSKTVENHTIENVKRRYLTSVTVQITIALSFVFGLYFFSKKESVKIERHTISSSYKPSVNSPSIKQLISWGSNLKLSKEQKEKLLALDLEQSRAIESIDKKLKDSVRSFKNSIEQSNKERVRVSLSDVSKMASPATKIGRQRRQLVNKYNSKALAILSKDQVEFAKRLFKTEMCKGSSNSVY